MKNTFRLAAVFFALTAASFAGVTVSSPKNGDRTNSPLHVVAAATPNSSSARVAVMQVYVDGGLVYQGAGSHIDTFLNVGYGNHTVSVKSWDSNGANSIQSVGIVGTGIGIFLRSPGANATLSGSAQVTASAYSPNNITTMRVYDNGNVVHEVDGSQMNKSIPLAPGSHYLVVQAWDAKGAVYFNPVTVNVPGASASTTQSTQSSSGSSSTTQANIPSGAIRKLDIDQMGGWESCDACAGINGNGPVNPYSMTQNISSPSIDGKSATFWLGGKIPWGAALWWKQLGPNDDVKHFVYDLKFYITNPRVAQGLEFDVNQSVGGLKYIFGTECDVRTNEGWRVWDTANVRWVKTNIPCDVKANSWNHLTWEFERVGNKTHFIAVTLNGWRNVVDKYYYAKPVGSAREINVAYQMDGNEYEDNYQTWLDKVSLYYW